MAIPRNLLEPNIKGILRWKSIRGKNIGKK